MKVASCAVVLLAACGSSGGGAAIDAAQDGPAPNMNGRSLVDRPDDVAGYQIHVMYVVPSDGTDRARDTDGSIARSISAIDGWFVAQTGGPRLRLDTSGGALDITFFRMSQSDAAVEATGAFVRDTIEQELRAANMLAPTKIYAVYYDGKSNYACGGGAWPPTLVGQVAAEYLDGAVPGAVPCAANPVGASATKPGYFEFAIYHEVLHTIGVVASCAPHFTLSGHVSDSATDLMYAGNLPWNPQVLDLGNDDYFKTGSSTCLDLAKSAFLEPLPANAQKPPGW